MISTEDFYTFRVMPLYGEGAQNKKPGIIPKKNQGMPCFPELTGQQLSYVFR
jgi:hypothetical protein